MLISQLPGKSLHLINGIEKTRCSTYYNHENEVDNVKGGNSCLT
jgi:hypothetical protein